MILWKRKRLQVELYGLPGRKSKFGWISSNLRTPDVRLYIALHWICLDMVKPMKKLKNHSR